MERREGAGSKPSGEGAERGERARGDGRWEEAKVRRRGEGSV